MLKDAIGLSSLLGNLIQLCWNAERKLSLAKECFRNGDVGTLFQHFAKQRARHRVELLSELRRQSHRDGYGGISDDSFDPWAPAQMPFQLDGGVELGLARSCEEESAGLIESYKEAVEAPLPISTLSLLHKHLLESQDTQEVLKVLARME